MCMFIHMRLKLGYLMFIKSSSIYDIPHIITMMCSTLVYHIYMLCFSLQIKSIQVL